MSGENRVDVLIVDDAPLESSSSPSGEYVPPQMKLESDKESESEKLPSHGVVEMSQTPGPAFVGVISGTATLGNEEDTTEKERTDVRAVSQIGQEKEEKAKSKCCILV